MAEARAVINVDINTSPAAAALRSLQGQLNAFTTALNRNNTEQALASKGIQRQLMSLVNTSKFFTAEMVRMETGASQLDKTLSKGQVTMGQFFSAKFRKDGLEASRVLSLAHARASALQTQFVATAGAANGFREAIAIRPLHAFNAEAAVSAERLVIQRAMLQQATTSMINFGKNTQWAGRQLMVGFTVPLTIFAATAGKTFMDIEKQSVAFKKVYGDAFTPPEEIEANLKAVQELGKEFTKYGIAVSDTMDLAAQAAAAGAKNADLIDATTEATRLATLGQLDQQKALETTIALQSAFALSGEKLAKSINFMNMVENQTVLTLQDLTDAIPRVAPVINGLGGSVEDMTIMLTAMKEGGITAAQGANALKSGLASLINPTDRAVEKLQKMGISLNSIVQTNRGDLMGTIQDFAKALQTVDEFQRQQALETVFGKFQYARLGALFNNIIKDGSQASRAMDAAAMSAEGLAATANKELGMIEESAATKFTAAMEKLKLAIAPIGEMFVKMATPILNFVSMIAEKFNNLPDFAKNFAALGTVLVGIVIPAGTMFLGLLMNLIGTLTKFGHLSTIFIKGLVQGGIRKAFENVTQATKYMSLAEIDATNAAQQLGGATEAVNQALLEQIGPTELATSAISGLAGAYDVLAQNMREAALVGGLPMQVPGASMMRAGNQGSMLYRPLPIVARNRGGSIPYLSGGGKPTVPGMGNTDTVPAMLTPGEFVVNKKATEQNLGLLHAINSGDVQYRNMGGGIAESGRKFYGMRPNPFSAAAQAALLRQQQYEASRGNIANIFGVPAGVSVSRSTNQSATQIASAKTRSQGIYQVLSKQQTKGADLIRQAVNLGLSPEELGLKAIGNFIVAMSPKANMAMARGSLTRSSLLGELGSNSVYAPIATQIQRYFGKSFNYDAFDSIYRDQISKLPAAGITNQRFEKASRNALRIYMEQQGYAKNQRKDFLRDILSGDTVRANVPVAKIRSMLSRNGIPFTESGADIYANINGKTYNFGDLAGRGIGYLGRSEGIFRYDKIDMPEGVARVHANKGGMIPGVQYFAARNKQRIVQAAAQPARERAPGRFAYKSTEYGEQVKEDLRMFEAAIMQLFPKKYLKGDSGKRLLRSMLSLDVAHKKDREITYQGRSLKVWLEKELYGAMGAENKGFELLFGKNRKTARSFWSQLSPSLNKSEQVYLSRFLDGIAPTSKKEIEAYLSISNKAKGYIENNPDNPTVQKFTALRTYRNKWFDAFELALSMRSQGKLGGTKEIKVSKNIPEDIDILGMNMGGIIPGGQVNSSRNFYGKFNAQTIDIFRKWIGSQPSEIAQMKSAVGRDKALTEMFGAGFTRSEEPEILQRSTWMTQLPERGSIMSLGSMASMSPKGTPVLQHLMDSKLQKDYEFAEYELSVAQRQLKEDAVKLAKIKAGDLPSWAPENKYFSPMSKKTGAQAYAEDLEGWIIPNNKKKVKETKSTIRNFKKNIPTIIELETPQGTIRANLDDIVSGDNQSFMGRKVSERERILHNANIEILDILDQDQGIKLIKARLISSQSPMYGVHPRSTGVLRQPKSYDDIVKETVRAKARASTVSGKNKDDFIFSRDENGKLNADPFDLLNLLRLNPNLSNKDFENIAKYHGSRIRRGRSEREWSTWKNIANILEEKGYPIVQKRNSGGFISPTLRANSGNIVPGVGNTDTVPAMLTPGEFVINKKATEQNLGILHAINSGKTIGMSKGGVQHFLFGGRVRGVEAGPVGTWTYTDFNGQRMTVGSLDEANRRQREVNRIIREAQRQNRQGQRETNSRSMSGMGRGMGLSMGMGAVGGAIMSAQMIPAVAQNETLSSVAQYGGLGLSLASMLPMMGKFGVALGALAAVTAPIAISLSIFRKRIDKAAEESLTLGRNVGGAASRMEELSVATGYQFSLERSKGRMFRFTPQEIQKASEFSPYFESERGQKFVSELQELSSKDRYEKVASIIAQGIADGMDPKTAKAYGDAIAAYTGDALLRNRLLQDFKNQKFQSGTKVLVDLVTKRQEEADKAIIKAGGNQYVPVTGFGGVGAQGVQNRRIGAGAIGGGVGAVGGMVAGGALAGVAAGTAIGASLGSIIPIAGTIIGAAAGAAIGLAIADRLDESNVKQLEANTKAAGVALGSSLEMLKEVANAEAAINEARINGVINAKEAEEQLADLRKVEAAAANNVKDVVAAMQTGAVDAEAMGLSLKNSLILNSGFDEGQAQAVIDTVSYENIASQLFAGVDPEKLTKDQKEVVSAVIAETLSGITPQNVGQKIADVSMIYSEIATLLLDAAADGLTLDEVRAIATGKAAGQRLLQALTDGVDEGMGVREQAEAAKRASKAGADAFGIYTDPETGRQFKRGKQKSRSLESIVGGAYETNTQTGFKELRKLSDGLDINAIFGGKNDFTFTTQDATAMQNLAKSLNMEVQDLFIASLRDPAGGKERIKALIEGIGTDSLDKDAYAQILGIDPSMVNDEIQGIVYSVQQGVYAFEMLQTENQKAADMWERYTNYLSRSGETAQFIEQITMEMENLALADKALALEVIQNASKRRGFQTLVKGMVEGIDITTVVTRIDDALRDPETTIKTIKKELKEIEKIDFKKFGKNWKDIRTEIQKISATDFFNKALAAGFDENKIGELYSSMASGLDVIKDAKIIGPKGTVKKEDLTQQLVVDVITSYGGNPADAPSIYQEIQNAFPNQLSPIMLPVIMQLITAGMDIGELAAAAGGKKFFWKDLGSVADAGQGAAGIAQQKGVKIEGGRILKKTGVSTDTLGFFEVLSGISGITPPTGPSGGSSGGGGQKSIIEQLKDQFKMLKDVFDGMSKYIKSKTGQFKGIAAGPFGPEFIEYLKSQGEEGIKILKNGGEKLKQAYNEFKKVQTQQAANFAQTFPATLIRRTKDIRIENQFRGKLSRKGFDQDTQDQFIEGIGGVEGIRRYNELVNKRNELKAKGKELSKEELDQLKAINQAMNLGGPAAKQLFAAITKKEVADNLREMRKETEDLSYLLSLGYTKEQADDLLQMGVNSSMTAGEIANLNDELKVLAARTANLRELEINSLSAEGQRLAGLEEIDQLDYEIKLIEEINKDEKMSALYAKEGVNNHEDLLAIYERQANIKSREIELEQRKLEPIDEQIKLLEEQMDKVEKSYDTQLEALDKIVEAESEIYALRERTLGLADALSKGDVAAAAQAALELERERASQRSSDQRSLLEQQRQQAIKSIEDQITVQKDKRKLIEDSITRLQKEQRAISDQIYNVQFIINEQAFRLQNTLGLGNNQLEILREKLKLARLEQEGLTKAALEALQAFKDAQAVQGKTPPAAPVAETTTSFASQAQVNAAHQAAIKGSPMAHALLAPSLVEANTAARKIIGYRNLPGFGIQVPIYAANGGKVSYKGSREPAPGFAMGGKVKYFANGGRPFGSDTVPAMLTPGEFVVRRSMAQAYGPLLESINSNVFPRVNMNKAMPSSSAKNDGSMYNYNVNVTLNGSDMDPNDVANVVMQKIKMKENMNVRNYNYRG